MIISLIANIWNGITPYPLHNAIKLIVEGGIVEALLPLFIQRFCQEFIEHQISSVYKLMCEERIHILIYGSDKFYADICR